MKLFFNYYLLLCILAFNLHCLGKTIQVSNQQQLEKELSASTNAIVAIVSPECPVCKAVLSPLEELSNKAQFNTIKFIKISFDHCTEFCSKHEVNVVPTFIFINKKSAAPLHIEHGIENQETFVKDMSKKIKEKYKI